MRKIRFSLVLVGVLSAIGLGTCAPPDVKSVIEAKPGQLVRVTVKSEKIGYLKNFTDDEAFFGELVSPVKTERQFVFQSPTTVYDKDGKEVPNPRTEYVLGWWTEGETSGVSTTIRVLGAKPPPETSPPPKEKVPPVIPAPTGKYYFLVVRKNGPADKSFTDIMGNAAWKTLAMSGHVYTDRELSKLDKLNIALDPNTVLPVVLTLSVVDGKSTVVRWAVPLPTTTAGILALPEGVK